MIQIRGGWEVGDENSEFGGRGGSGYLEFIRVRLG